MARIKTPEADAPLNDWARFLGMDVTDVIYFVKEEGLTIEQLCKIRGKKPKVPKVKRIGRKPGSLYCPKGPMGK